MPTTDELNEMSQLMFKRDFDAFWGSDTANKGMVMKMCLLARQNTILAAIQNDTDTLAQVAWGK